MGEGRERKEREETARTETITDCYTNQTDKHIRSPVGRSPGLEDGRGLTGV